MVGDNPDADIAGALACSLRSIWLDRGRRWTETAYRPDAICSTVAQAVERILADAS